MTNSELQIGTDATMASILKANATLVFNHDHDDIVARQAESTSTERDSELAFRVNKCHVSKDGFITLKGSSEEDNLFLQKEKATISLEVEHTKL